MQKNEGYAVEFSFAKHAPPLRHGAAVSQNPHGTVEFELQTAIAIGSQKRASSIVVSIARDWNTWTHFRVTRDHLLSNVPLLWRALTESSRYEPYTLLVLNHNGFRQRKMYLKEEWGDTKNQHTLGRMPECKQILCTVTYGTIILTKLIII